MNNNIEELVRGVLKKSRHESSRDDLYNAFLAMKSLLGTEEELENISAESNLKSRKKKQSPLLRPELAEKFGNLTKSKLKRYIEKADDELLFDLYREMAYDGITKPESFFKNLTSTNTSQNPEELKKVKYVRAIYDRLKSKYIQPHLIPSYIKYKLLTQCGYDVDEITKLEYQDVVRTLDGDNLGCNEKIDEGVIAFQKNRLLNRETLLNANKKRKISDESESEEEVKKHLRKVSK